MIYKLVLSFSFSIAATICILLEAWQMAFVENLSFIFVIAFSISFYLQIFFEMRPEIKDKKIFNNVYNEIFTVILILGCIIIALAYKHMGVFEEKRRIYYQSQVLGITWIAYFKLLDLISHTLCVINYYCKK